MTVNVVSFSFSDAQPEVLGSTLQGDGFPYCIVSASSLDPNSIRAPDGPFGRVWLSLPHSSPPSPTLLELYCQLNSTQLSYIIVQRLLDRPLDLWNRMFNRHQAEITVMQFRGHSLPVRQSMRVSWDFLACPILSANFHPRDFLSWLPLECVTSFRFITLNGILGRVEGQNITKPWTRLLAFH